MFNKFMLVKNCVKACANDNVRPVRSHSQENLDCKSKDNVNNVAQMDINGYNLVCIQILGTNSEDTRQSGCQANALCPTWDGNSLCRIGDSSLGAVSRTTADLKDNANNTNGTFNNVVDHNSEVGPRVVPVTYSHNGIVIPHNNSNNCTESTLSIDTLFNIIL